VLWRDVNEYRQEDYCGEKVGLENKEGGKGDMRTKVDQEHWLVCHTLEASMLFFLS
jgi:hypothetical protein